MAQDATPLRFRKMHGAGNDFVIVDARDSEARLTSAQIRALGDRHRGVGFDQFAMVKAAEDADASVEFFNQDGGRSGACGNATRCIASLLMAEAGRDRLTLRTGRGVLTAELREGAIWVDMGQPILDWRAIPLAREVDPDALPLAGRPSALSMGNPHCVFFLDEAAEAPVETMGPRIETDPLFPERCNVEFVRVLNEHTVRAEVWERGTGPTLACGSGACAIVVAGVRRGLLARRASVALPGGVLEVDWPVGGGVWLSGPVASVFAGVIDPAFLEAAR